MDQEKLELELDATPEQERALAEEEVAEREESYPEPLENRRRYGHSATLVGAEEEGWQGSFKTREEAIVDGKKHHEGGFWVSSGFLCDSSQFLPLVDHVAEVIRSEMNERVEEQLGVVAEDWPEVDPDAQKALALLLIDWARHYLPCPFWLPSSDAYEYEYEYEYEYVEGVHRGDP